MVRVHDPENFMFDETLVSEIEELTGEGVMMILEQAEQDFIRTRSDMPEHLYKHTL